MSTFGTNEDVIHLKWLKKISFESQKGVLCKVNDLEDINPYFTESEAQCNKLIDIDFKDYTKKQIDCGLVEVIENEDGTFNFRLTTEITPYASILNREGIVCIADTIYQYKDGFCKKITDGDFSMVELMKKSTKTEKSILVSKSLKRYVVNQAFLSKWPWGEIGEYVYDGKERMRAHTSIREYIYDNGLRDYLVWYANENEKKNWLGNWKWHDDADIYISIEQAYQKSSDTNMTFIKKYEKSIYNSAHNSEMLLELISVSDIYVFPFGSSVFDRYYKNLYRGGAHNTFN